MRTGRGRNKMGNESKGAAVIKLPLHVSAWTTRGYLLFSSLPAQHWEGFKRKAARGSGTDKCPVVTECIKPIPF
jgi:hypothetical protein